MSNNPLEKWASLIAVTSGWVLSHDEADAKSDCIQDLAAEVRAERKRVAELETQLDRECSVCDKWAPPGLVHKLQARVAELEDALWAVDPALMDKLEAARKEQPCQYTGGLRGGGGGGDEMGDALARQCR